MRGSILCPQICWTFAMGEIIAKSNIQNNTSKCRGRMSFRTQWSNHKIPDLAAVDIRHQFQWAPHAAWGSGRPAPRRWWQRSASMARRPPASRTSRSAQSVNNIQKSTFRNDDDEDDDYVNTNVNVNMKR